MFIIFEENFIALQMCYSFQHMKLVYNLNQEEKQKTKAFVVPEWFEYLMYVMKLQTCALQRRIACCDISGIFTSYQASRN